MMGMTNVKPDIKKVLIISKMTGLDFDEFKYGAAMNDYHRANNIDVESLRKEHDFHYESLEKIVALFEREGTNPGRIDKQNLSSGDFEKNWDVVIPVGGDGTFMDAARYIFDDTPVFGIKSSPFSIGGHYNTSFATAEAHIKKLLSGDYTIRQRTRIEGTIRNKYTIQDLALNEIFIGDYFNPGFAWLDTYINGEHFKTGSSGIVISTYTGRTGWFDNVGLKERDPKLIDAYNAAHRAAGLPERNTLIDEAEFLPDEHGVVKYKVREQAQGSYGKWSSYGILKPGDKLNIIMRSKVDGSVGFDGNKPNRPRHRMYELHYNNNILVKISDKPLSVIWINE